ncbi:WD40 repeat domain-containing protein [Longispora urticae]
MSTRLRELLRTAGDAMPPARLPGDLWKRGRRRRTRQRVAVALAILLVAAAVVPWGVRTPRAPLGAAGAAVPGKVFVPWMWQATVRQAPAGPASVLFSGDGSLGLSGDKLIDDEGKLVVVGRDGSYRTLLYGAPATAGESAQVSPDGRYVAQGYLDNDPGLNIIDLATGTVRRLAGPDGADCCVESVGWSRDGRWLLGLAHHRMADHLDAKGNGISRATLVLFEVATGATTPLVEYPDLARVRRASVAAFSPDAQRIAVTVGTELRMLDRSGNTLWTRDLGARRHLVGLGAFTPDGARIGTATLDGCLLPCGAAELGARRWTFGYLDGATGADTVGPSLPAVTGVAVRGLGWRHGADLVAVVLRAGEDVATYPDSPPDSDYYTAGHARLVALSGGGAETLLDPPSGVKAIDVPLDLVEAGRFGGPSVPPEPFPVRGRFVVLAAGLVTGLVFVVGVVVAFGIPRRRVRR